MAPLPLGALKEEVFALAVSKELVQLYCNQCLKREIQLFCCEKCQKIWYCGEECMEKDSEGHKEECRILENRKEIPDDGIRLLIRICTLTQIGEFGEIRDGEILPKVTRSLLDLKIHDAEFSDAENVLLEKGKELKLEERFSKEMVGMLIKKLSKNSFTISNCFGTPIGIGICIKLSVARHSCNPVTRVVYRNREACLFLINSENWPEKLEEASHSFIDELQPRAERRAILKQKYKFECNCEGCKDEPRNTLMEAYCCGICMDGWMKNERNSQCVLCGWEMEEEHFEMCRISEEAAKTARNTLNADETPTEQRLVLAEKYYESFKDTLYKFNVLRLPLLRVLFGISVLTSNIEEAKKYGIELLELMKQYQKPNDPSILFFKYGLARIMVAGEAYESALELLEHINEKFVEMFGEDAKVCELIRGMFKLCAEKK